MEHQTQTTVRRTLKYQLLLSAGLMSLQVMGLPVAASFDPALSDPPNRSRISALPETLRSTVLRTPDRSDDVLIAELKHLNATSTSFIEGYVQPKLKEVQTHYASIVPLSLRMELMVYATKAVKDWTAQELTHWCTQFKTLELSVKQRSIPSFLAVLMRAAHLTHGVVPRSTQMLAVLATVHPEERVGRCVEVATGEGKSLITAMTAATHAMLGRSVDIATSSEPLCERDAQEQRAFYRAVGLDCAHVSCDGASDLQRAYDAPIVYGTLHLFSGHLLTQSFQGHMRRGRRPFEVLLIDEVDSVLIDRMGDFTQLATPLPGMEAFLPLLAMMQRTVQELHAEGHPMDMLRARLTRQAQQVIRGEIPDLRLGLSERLRTFAAYQIPLWVESVLRALFHHQADRDHIVHDNGDIRPVDYQHTGVVHTNQVYSDGTHQCIQLQRHAYLTPETLLSSFMSTLSYVSQYRGRLYGLTGTLGDAATHAFLHQVYQVTCLRIPTFRPKQLTVYPAQLLDTSTAWQDAIATSISEVVQQGRAVLVLCETIDRLHGLKAMLTPHYPSQTLHVYARNDVTGADAPVVPTHLDAGHILLATNLAGRGTDLKLGEGVEAKGGLHVCMTFLPLNERVEAQNMGRTARQGSPGTAQMILHRSGESLTLEALRRRRDRLQQQQFSHRLAYHIPDGKFQDQLFDRIQAVMTRLRGATSTGMPAFSIDTAKCTQVAELWALQYQLIRTYGERVYAIQTEALRQHATSMGYTLQEMRPHRPDALFDVLSEATEMSALDLHQRVLQYVWTKEASGDPERFRRLMDEYMAASDRFLNAVSHVLGTTLVVVSHTGLLRIVRQRSDKLFVLGELTGGQALRSPGSSPLSATADPILPGVFEVVPPYRGHSTPHSATTAPEHLLPRYVRLTAVTKAAAERMVKRIEAVEPMAVATDAGLYSAAEDEDSRLYERYQEAQAQYYERYFAAEAAYIEPVMAGFLRECERRYTTPRGLYLGVPDLVRLVERLTDEEWTHYLQQALTVDPGLGYALQYAQARRAIVKGGDTHIPTATRALQAVEDGLIDANQPWALTFALTQANGESPLAKQIHGRMNFMRQLQENVRQNLSILRNCAEGNVVKLGDPKHWVAQFTDIGVIVEDQAALRANGVAYFYTLEERPPEPTAGDLFGMAVLGIVQSLGGAVLMLSGVGMNLGLTALSEGLKDLWKTTTGEAIQWGRYWLQKGVTLLMSAVGAAWSSIKEGSKLGADAVGRALMGPAAVNATREQVVEHATEKICGAILRSTVEVGVGYAVDRLRREAMGAFQARIRATATETLGELSQDTSFIGDLRQVLAFEAATQGRWAVVPSVRGAMDAWSTNHGGEVLSMVNTVLDTLNTARKTDLLSVLSVAGEFTCGVYNVVTTVTFMRRYRTELTAQIQRAARQLPDLKTVLTTISGVEAKIVETWLTHAMGKGLVRGGQSYTLQAKPDSDGLLPDLREAGMVMFESTEALGVPEAQVVQHPLMLAMRRVVQGVHGATKTNPDLSVWVSHMTHAVNGRIHNGIGAQLGRVATRGIMMGVDALASGAEEEWLQYLEGKATTGSFTEADQRSLTAARRRDQERKAMVAQREAASEPLSETAAERAARQQATVDAMRADEVAVHARVHARAQRQRDARARASENEYKFNPDGTKQYASELPTEVNARVIPGMVADNPVEAMQALMADPNTTRSVAEAATDARDLRERVGNPWHMGRRDRERMHAAQSERGRTVNALAQAYDGSLVQRGVNATSDALGSVVGTATKGVVLALSGVETVDEMVTLSRVYDETTGPIEALGQGVHAGAKAGFSLLGATDHSADVLADATVRSAAILGVGRMAAPKVPGVLRTTTQAATRAAQSTTELVSRIGVSADTRVMGSGPFGALQLSQKVVAVETAIESSLKIESSVINGLPLAGTLPAPFMIRHHLFNKFRGQSAQSEKYRQFFRAHGIEVDKFCIEIPESTHVMNIHKAGANWTTKWKEWIDNNSSATTKEVYQFAGKLMDEYGVSHVNIVKYRE